MNQGEAQVGHMESHTTMCQEDYPNIKFWTKCQWTEFLSNTLTDIHAGPQARGWVRAAQGINVTMRDRKSVV